MSIYVTSDLHFGHNRPFIYEARGFDSIEEMNQAYVERWNNTVTPEDEVYVLGDLMLGDKNNIKYIERLNGKLHIVYGNHDTSTRQVMYKELPNVVECCWATMVHERKWNFFLSHFPCMTSNYDDDKGPKARIWNLCGHSHYTNRWEDFDKGLACYHVEVDAHNGCPVKLEDIIQEIKGRLAATRSTTPLAELSGGSEAPAAL